MQLYGRLSALASDLTGHGVDFQPTDQQREVGVILNDRLKKVKENFDILFEHDIPELNKRLKSADLKIQTQKEIKS
jgi:hypothetical protein